MNIHLKKEGQACKPNPVWGWAYWDGGSGEGGGGGTLYAYMKTEQ
jgi:hypothetical protein